MESIFNNTLSKGKITDCGFLRQFTTSFFLSPKNHSIECYFFHFGLLFESLHYLRNEKWNKEIFTPTRDIYRGQIDHQVIASVQLGRDLSNEYDEAEADKYDPYFWRITKAVEYERPDWAFYMFAGNIQALFNGNRIMESRLLQYLELFPKQFIATHKERLQYAFNYFDERGYLLSFKEVPTLIKVGRGLYDEVLAIGSI